jgi:hypothetical protein
VSINVLEFVMVIINYCAALHIFRTTKVTEDPHSVLLDITDNASTLSWTLHTCRRSKIGHLLARFFCSLLNNSPLGINSQWITTDDNKIANDISCLKKQSDTNSAPNFNYNTLKQTYPELDHCSFFSDSARAHLKDMGDCVDREMAKSRGGPDVETEAARKLII